MALSAFANAASKNDEQKAALLAAIAQNGAAGKAQFDRAAADVAAQQAQTAQATKERTDFAPAALVAQLQQGTAQVYGDRAADVAQAQGTFDRDIAAQNNANGNYMSQLGAAIPVVEARTRLGVEQTIREQQEAERDRALQREMAGLDLQSKRESLAAAKDAREADKTTISTAQQKLDAENANKKSQDFTLSMLTQHASPGTQRAFFDLVAQAKSLPEAISRIRQLAGGVTIKNKDGSTEKRSLNGTYGTDVSASVLEDWVRRYFSPSDDEIALAMGGYKEPAAPPPSRPGDVLPHGMTGAF